MAKKTETVQLIAVDRLSGGLVVTFSNGESLFCSAEFLLEGRGDSRNRVLPDIEKSPRRS